MVADGILESVAEATEWCTPIVLVAKKEQRQAQILHSFINM